MPQTVHQVPPVIICFYWGFVLTALFYGVTFAQACSYFRTFPNDKRLLKSLVVVVMLLCTIQFVLTGITIYGWVIRVRGDFEALNNEPKAFQASMAGTTVIAFTVEIIYAVRIHRLSNRNLWFTGVIVVLALLGAGGGTAMVVTIVEHPFWSKASTNFIPSVVCLAGTVSCDIAIAGIQIYLFRRQLYSGTHGKSRLKGALKKLMRIVAGIGALTTADALVFLVTFLQNPANGFFIIPYLLLCNCYLNSFLSLLNQRVALRDIVDSDELTTLNISRTLQFRRATTSQLVQSESGDES